MANECAPSGILGNIVRGLDNVSHQHMDIASRIGCFSVPFLSNPDFINRPEILKWMKEQHDSHAGRIALVGKDGLGYEISNPSRYTPRLTATIQKITDGTPLRRKNARQGPQM
jgi:hypothetical protein